MTAAPYNLNTVGRIQALASLGKGPSAIGVDLDWPAERVTRTAQRHGIDLPSDPGPKAKQPPAPPAAVDPPTQKARHRKGTSSRHIKRGLKGHPRSIYLASVAVSPSARESLARIMTARDKSAAGLAGITLDYILRHGLFDDLCEHALAEAEAENA